MARTSKGRVSIRKHGSPATKTNRRINNPANGDEAAQMIADDIESEVLSFINRMSMERAINRMDMRQVLGVGGPNLQQYEELIKTGFAEAIEDGADPASPFGQSKDDHPVLNQISNEIELKSTVKAGGADTTAEPDPKSRQSRKKRGK